MAQLGAAPLRILPATNSVTCAACGAHLRPRAAGAPLTAYYEGPTLVRVVIEERGAAHDCETTTTPPPATAGDTTDPGDF